MNAEVDSINYTYARIEKAIKFIEANFHRQPSLEEIARSAHMSEYHFQRVFSTWVGISPKRFLQFLTKEYAKELLAESRNLLDVTYEAGLSSPGRLHDLFVTCEGVTPGEYKSQGRSITIEFGFHESPFGDCLLAVTEKGICGLDFVQEMGREHELAELRTRWENAHFLENPAATTEIAQRLFAKQEERDSVPFHVYLKGTNFQLKVWEALLRIPYAHVVCYEDVASLIGKPNAVRAVANAVGSNPVPFLIPCHRVIRKMGTWGGYGGGRARKKAIIGWEASYNERVARAMVGKQ